MRTDVSDLYEFYRTSLGRTAQRMLRRRLRALWPNVAGMTVVGLGYAAPVLRPFRDEAARCVAVMPASQGVMRWPEEERNAAALAEETELPFPDLSVDRMILVHAVETAEQLRPMMREIWRVLTGSGRIVVVVPNRRGLWARFDNNPFGSGRPYSASQLRRLIRDTLFTPLQATSALYVPPGGSRMLLTGAEAWENIGVRWFPRIGGVIMLEATKQVYAAPRMKPAHRRVAYAQPPQAALPPAAAGATRDAAAGAILAEAPAAGRGTALSAPLSCAPKIEPHGDRT